MENRDIFYVVGKPKADGKLMKVLETVGNALAEEKGLPKPGEKIGVSETTMEAVGCPIYTEGLNSPYLELAVKVERLKRGAGLGGLWVDFDLHGDMRKIIKSETIERKESSPLVDEVTKSHSFKVKGYVSHTYPLAKNIDLLETDGDNLANVKKTIDENGRENVLYTLLDEFMSYSPNPTCQSNTEKVFGLGDDRLYTDVKTLLKEEIGEKYAKLDGSKIAKLSDSEWKIPKFIGSRYRAHESDKIEKYRAEQEKKIDTLRGRFSEIYKFSRANASSFTK